MMLKKWLMKMMILQIRLKMMMRMNTPEDWLLMFKSDALILGLPELQNKVCICWNEVSVE